MTRIKLYAMLGSALFWSALICLPTLAAPKAKPKPKPKPVYGFTADVYEVHDGDTLTVLRGEKTERVRLLWVDAPELSQPYGPEARDELKRLVGQRVRVLYSERDRYGRILGDVRSPAVLPRRQTSINRGMVRFGWAYVYSAYPTPEAIRKDEEAAKSDKRGVWQTPDLILPWEYRKQQRSKPKQAFQLLDVSAVLRYNC